MNEDYKTEGMKKRKGFVDSFHRLFEKIVVKSKLLTKCYSYFNKKMTLDEFKIVNIPDNSKCLCIGCGSLPWTLITLGKAKNWQFTGIDRDPKAVETAKKVIEYFNLSDKIMIKNEEGLNFDVSGYDLIIIAFGVTPREELLEKIGKNMKKDGMILYRKTWEKLDRVYGSEIIPQDFKIKDIFYRMDGVKSLLLTKNEKNK